MEHCWFAMVIILVPKHLATPHSPDDRRPSVAQPPATAGSHNSFEYKFSDGDMPAQIADVLSLAHVGSGPKSFELYALAQQDKSYIDHRSSSKDYASWNAFQQLELINHPVVAAEDHGSSLRKLQQEVKVIKQHAMSSGEGKEKTASSITEVVKRSVSIFHDLKKKNSPSDMFMWDLLATKYITPPTTRCVLITVWPGMVVLSFSWTF